MLDHLLQKDCIIKAFYSSSSECINLCAMRCLRPLALKESDLGRRFSSVLSIHSGQNCKQLNIVKCQNAVNENANAFDDKFTPPENLAKKTWRVRLELHEVQSAYCSQKPNYLSVPF